ncbi:MAG: class I SAM-dependent methyltransferase [Paracoccaceae bacterium]
MDKLSFRIFKTRIMQKLFGRSLDVRKSWEETPKDYSNMVDFLNWFDATKSVPETISKASSDWLYRFQNFPHFSHLPKRTALEIGFGGGRLLSQAAKCFETVYGVDIHQNFAMSKKFLSSLGVSNVALFCREEINRIPDESVDFVYSFIVFQHFDKIEEVDFYLNHIHRLLTPEGMAHIYFGKNKNEGIKTTPDAEFLLRDCSLFIHPRNMLERVSNRFQVLSFQDVLPRDPVANTGESVQAMILFKK